MIAPFASALCGLLLLAEPAARAPAAPATEDDELVRNLELVEQLELLERFELLVPEEAETPRREEKPAQPPASR
jgi:hypothetical protein